MAKAKTTVVSTLLKGATGLLGAVAAQEAGGQNVEARATLAQVETVLNSVKALIPETNPVLAPETSKK